MIQGFQDHSCIIASPDIVSNTPSIFHHILPHSMPVYKPHFTSKPCLPYACNIPYEKDQCYNFR